MAYTRTSTVSGGVGFAAADAAVVETVERVGDVDGGAIETLQRHGFQKTGVRRKLIWNNYDYL